MNKSNPSEIKELQRLRRRGLRWARGENLLGKRGGFKLRNLKFHLEVLKTPHLNYDIKPAWFALGWLPPGIQKRREHHGRLNRELALLM